jgi:hypothetical protein
MSCNCWHGLIIKDNGDVEKCTKCNKELGKHKLPNSVRIVHVSIDLLTPDSCSIMEQECSVRYQRTPEHVKNALMPLYDGYFYARLEPNDTWTILNRIEDQEW